MSIPIIPRQKGFLDFLTQATSPLLGQEIQRRREESLRQRQAERFKEITSSEEFKNLPIAQQASLTSMLFGKEVAQPFMEQLKRTEVEPDLSEYQDILQKADFSTPEGQRAFIGEATRRGMKVTDAVNIIKQFKPSGLTEFLSRYTPEGQQRPGIPEADETETTELITPRPIRIPEVSIQPQKSPIENIPDSDLVVAMGSEDKNLSEFAKGALDLKDKERKNFNADRKYHADKAKKHMDSIDEERDTIRDQRANLEGMKIAIKDRDLSQYTKDWWAGVFGRWGRNLVSPEGAILSTNVKEFLLSGLRVLKGRPNQYIEQLLIAALPEIGKTKFANMASIASLEQRIRLQEKKIEITDRLSDEYEKKLGYVPGNIGQIVNQAMSPYVEQEQKRFAYTLRKIQEEDQGIEKLSKKRVIPGTPLTLEMANYFKGKYRDKEKVWR